MIGYGQSGSVLRDSTPISGLVAHWNWASYLLRDKKMLQNAYICILDGILCRPLLFCAVYKSSPKTDHNQSFSQTNL